VKAVSALLPICRENGLNIVRSLGNGLIPGQAVLAGETRHGLDELLHLIVQQMLTIAGLNRFHLIGGTPVPVLNGDLIRRTVDRYTQIIGLPAEHQIERIDAGAIAQHVGISRRRIVLVDLVLPITAVDYISVVAGSAFQHIVP